MKRLYYKCLKSGKVFPFSRVVYTNPEYSPYYNTLELEYDYTKIKYPKNSLEQGWQKYIDLLPINKVNVSFNEVKTPVIKLENFGKQKGYSKLYVKDESRNLTDCFKDREAYVAINKAMEWGIDKLFTVSSGNAALSTAAYSQIAKINCDCIVPIDLSVGKRFLISLYGAHIVPMKGDYETLYRWVIDNKYDGWNATPGYNPIKDEGPKMIGFEIFDDIGVPDVIIIPCGNGTLLYSIFKAFKELNILRVINKMPRFIGVQIHKASPIHKAFMSGKDYEILEDIPDSIAEGIIACESYSSPKVIHALNETGGEMVQVNDHEVIQSLKDIVTQESIIPEPTSASVFAAFKKLDIPTDQKIVLIQSAGGFKNLKEIMESLMNVHLD